jgi:hypothetical protein
MAGPSREGIFQALRDPWFQFYRVGRACQGKPAVRRQTWSQTKLGQLGDPHSRSKDISTNVIIRQSMWDTLLIPGEQYSNLFFSNRSKKSSSKAVHVIHAPAHLHMLLDP